MLDSLIRPFIDTPLNKVGKYLLKIGISANTMTIIGFVLGLIAMLFIYNQQLSIAFICIVLSRLADGFDGAIARNSKLTDFGGFLDTVCDFIIYSGIVFSFGLYSTENLPHALFLIFSFIGPTTSFLAYAIIAGKRKISTDKRGKKSFYYLGGICEGTETIFTLLLMCVIPQYFGIICIIYGVLCWMTTMGRIYNAWIDFL